MPDASTRVKGSIFIFLCQGQHRLVCLLVVTNVSVEHESMSLSVVPESLNVPLQLGGKCILCPSAKESVIQLPPGGPELQVNIELVNKNFGFSPLCNEF